MSPLNFEWGAPPWQDSLEDLTADTGTCCETDNWSNLGFAAVWQSTYVCLPFYVPLGVSSGAWCTGDFYIGLSWVEAITHVKQSFTHQFYPENGRPIICDSKKMSISTFTAIALDSEARVHFENQTVQHSVTVADRVHYSLHWMFSLLYFTPFGA